jgi:hypothetical protein
MGVVSMANSVMHMAGHGELFYKVQHSDDNADGLQTRDQHAASVVCIYVVHPAICSSFYASITHVHCVCLLSACLLHAPGGSLGRTLSPNFHLPLLMPQIHKCIVVMLSASVLHHAGGSLGRTLSASEARAAAAGSAWGGTLPAGAAAAAAAAAQGLLASGGSWRDTVGSGSSYSGTVRSASNSRISSISTGSQALAAAAGPAGAGAAGVLSNSAVGVPGSGVLGQNAAAVGAGVGAAAGAKPVYARLPSLQQLSVDVNALPVEASSAAGKASQSYIL